MGDDGGIARLSTGDGIGEEIKLQTEAVESELRLCLLEELRDCCMGSLRC